MVVVIALVSPQCAGVQFGDAEVLLDELSKCGIGARVSLLVNLVEKSSSRLFGLAFGAGPAGIVAVR